MTINRTLADLPTSTTYDVNGKEIILDADADTSITADTDDQIDIKIAGADDFQFTANTMSVLSGSTLNIDSGATIANSGTATGFGLTGVTTGSGNVTITSGNLIVASGNGIDFSATADSGGTMSSELLDDYEEGSWTPAIVGGTQVISSIQRATYTKIGRAVILHVYVSQSNVTDGTSLSWSGVPFTSAGYNNSGIVEFYGNSSGSPILCRVGDATTVINFYKCDVNQGAITQTQNDTHTIFTLTYEAT